MSPVDPLSQVQGLSQQDSIYESVESIDRVGAIDHTDETHNWTCSDAVDFVGQNKIHGRNFNGQIEGLPVADCASCSFSGLLIQLGPEVRGEKISCCMHHIEFDEPVDAVDCLRNVACLNIVELHP